MSNFYNNTVFANLMSTALDRANINSGIMDVLNKIYFPGWHSGISKMINSLENNRISSNKYFMLKITFGGTTISNSSKLIQGSNLNAISSFTQLAQGIHNKFNSNPFVFERQMNLTEQLTSSYFSINSLHTPAWVDKLSTYKPTSNNALTFIDLFSAETFSHITEAIDEIDQSLEETGEMYREFENLITENTAIKVQIEKIFKSLRKLERKQSKKHKHLKEPDLLLVNLVFKLLQENISKNKIRILIVTILFVLRIVWDITIEAKGEYIFNKVFSEESYHEEDTKIIYNNQINITQNIQLNTDSTINKCSVYLRSSTKSKLLETLKPGAIILILDQKPNWCFIQTVVTKRDKKSKQDIEKVVKGWVLKKHLNYFQ